MTRKQRNQFDFTASLASVDANVSQLPQTVWQTADKDAPFMSKVSGSEFKPELKARPILTIQRRLETSYTKTSNNFNRDALLSFSSYADCQEERKCTQKTSLNCDDNLTASLIPDRVTWTNKLITQRRMKR